MNVTSSGGLLWDSGRQATKPASQNAIRWIVFSNETLGQTGLLTTWTRFGSNWHLAETVFPKARLQTLGLGVGREGCYEYASVSGQEHSRAWAVGKTPLHSPPGELQWTTACERFRVCETGGCSATTSVSSMWPQGEHGAQCDAVDVPWVCSCGVSNNDTPRTWVSLTRCPQLLLQDMWLDVIKKLQSLRYNHSQGDQPAHKVNVWQGNHSIKVLCLLADVRKRQEGQFSPISMRTKQDSAVLMAGLSTWNETQQAICVVSLDKFHLLIIVQKILAFIGREKKLLYPKSEYFNIVKVLLL